MVSVTVKVGGLEGLNLQADRMPREVEQAVKAGLFAIAMIARNEAVRLVHEPPKTGRIYGNHQASAPGEAPATDTGALAGSIFAEPGSENLSAILVARMPYATHLEFGTRNMEPRPFMSRAAVFATQKAPEIIAAYVQKVLGKSSGPDSSTTVSQGGVTWTRGLSLTPLVGSRD